MPLRLRRSFPSMSVSPPILKKATLEIGSDVEENNPNIECDVYEFENPKHAKDVLLTFDQLREKEIFTDVILSTNEKEFPCHRAVLVSGSKYFRAMFCNDHRESREMLVQINGMKADIMALLLNYLYTSRASITAGNVQPLLEASNLFQIKGLVDACTKFLEAQLDPCNCIGMCDFAETHALTELFAKASNMISEKFADVVLYEEFLELSKTRIIDYISDDNINVAREEIVYEAVKRWVKHNHVTRPKDFAELLSYVRLPLIHPNYFVNVIECDEEILANPSCQSVLQETRKYHILGNEINSAQTRPRRSTGCSVAVVIVGGSDKIGGYSTPYVDAFDPVTEEWSSLAKLPAFTKSEYAVTSFRNSILLSGGRIHSKDVWLYQSHIDNWVKIAPLRRGRWQHRMIALGGHVYAVGGYDGKSRLLNVEKYDSFSNCWYEMAPLLSSVVLFALAACNGKLYVIGTDDLSSACTLQVYSPDANLWAMRQSMPFPQRSIAASTINGRIYVIGSSDKHMYNYDPITNSWISCPVMADRLENCGMTVCGGKLYISGGKGDDQEASDIMYCYNVITNKMVQVTSMPRPSFLHGCVTIHRYCSAVATSG